MRCGGTPCPPEPFYDGKGTDEAWRTMLDAEARATKDDAKAVTLIFPADAEKIPTATKPKLTWTSPLVATSRVPARKRSMLSRVGDLVYGSAWAHLPPVTGPVHLLRISVPKRSCPIEVLTTSMSTGSLIAGFARQVAWVVALGLLLRWLWRIAVRRFDAVGI